MPPGDIRSTSRLAETPPVCSGGNLPSGWGPSNIPLVLMGVAMGSLGPFRNEKLQEVLGAAFILGILSPDDSLLMEEPSRLCSYASVLCLVSWE